MRRACGLALALAAAACGHPDGARPAPPVAGGETGAGAPSSPAPADDANQASSEEQLAAIQKAMNELDEAAQACWAAAAVERFDIEGELEARIEIERGDARIELVRDTARNPKLAACVGQVLARYPWAPPLHGQTIQLPFRFRAPGGQNVIDRALVPWLGQGKVAVAVLLDENNAGNAAASMFELAIAAGGSTGARQAERAELWYFLGAARVGAGRTARAVAAGDMMFVPRDGVREVAAAGADVHAVVVMVPGGREGSARAGALPTREVGTTRAAPVGPVFLPAVAATAYPRSPGQVTLFAEPSTIRDNRLAASVIELPAGAAIPEHVHDHESELLYVLSGGGTMTVAGVAVTVAPSSVVQIPPATRHAFTAGADLRAVQIYTPAGPEQRFKRGPAPAKARP